MADTEPGLWWSKGHFPWALRGNWGPLPLRLRTLPCAASSVRLPVAADRSRPPLALPRRLSARGSSVLRGRSYFSPCPEISTPLARIFHRHDHLGGRRVS